ncbi:TauD/TfdA family dioxygenase [Moorena producens]|uniref:TauD/TfdA family dioxygenase n=1 Tax=Moorena producens TaxID=1155739 RepID=UPI003C749100
MTQLKDPTLWSAHELLNSKYWNYHLTPAEVGEIEAAINTLKVSHSKAVSFNQLKKTLTAILEELENGTGTVLLKGVPVDQYSEEELAEVYLILCQQMGIPIRQSNSDWDSPSREKSQFVTSIRAEADSSQNGKQSNDAYKLHTDRYDVLSLLCVRQARVGGENRLASAVTIYNEMQRSHPGIAEDLFQGMPWLYDGEGGWISYPTWQIHKGKFTTQVSSTYPYLSQLIEGAPRLTERHKEGLNLLQVIGSQVGITLRLEPGDWLMVNNHVVYHARASWKIESGNYDRLLLRVCFSPYNSRELPDTDPFRRFWGSVEAGQPRGGFLPNHKLPPDQAIHEALSETESYWLDRYLKVRWVGLKQTK